MATKNFDFIPEYYDLQVNWDKRMEKERSFFEEIFHSRDIDRVLDIGCGAGFTSLGLARLVGKEGMVIAADIQSKMLKIVQERAIRERLSDRIRIHLCSPDKIGLREELDLAVAFFMVHEVPDIKAFIEEIYTLLKPGGRFFITEPMVHVGILAFQQMIQTVENIGFEITERPKVIFGRTALLEKRN